MKIKIYEWRGGITSLLFPLCVTQYVFSFKTQITFLDLLQKSFFSKSHDNFLVTAWEARVWDPTLLFVFGFLRKCRQVTLCPHFQSLTLTY